jgi:hypothetical protein
MSIEDLLDELIAEAMSAERKRMRAAGSRRGSVAGGER